MTHRISCALLSLSLLYLPVISQETPVVRIGVALPTNVPQISDTQVRDRLVKAINAHKPDKKLKMIVQAVGLSVPPGGRAVAEAKGKDCTLVFYSQMKPLETSVQFSRTADGSVINTPLAAATLEYLVKRVSDGATYAAGAAQSDASVSSHDAIVQAIDRVSKSMFSDLRKGGSNSSNSLAESGTLEERVPTVKPDAFTGTNFCAWLPSDITHADALRGVCDYAMTLPQRMPNFVCHQQTSRFQGHSNVPSDLITGTVRYEDGDESYSSLEVNGKPVAESVARSAGLWSTGQFEGNLRAIFHNGNHAAFVFSGEKSVGDRTALVFTYRIAKQNEPLWQLWANDQVVSPPYEGELWVDAGTSHLLRFESSARDLPSHFPIQSAQVLTDYGNVEFGDGTAFVLPAASTISTRFQGFELTRNVVEFRGCHKFRATARMLLSVADAAAEKSSDAARAEELRKSELEEDETIYAILREQAIKEDAGRLEAEQQQELNWATIGAMSRLAALEKQREKNSQELTAENSPAPAVSATESVAKIKVNVSLVPVSVVVRDSKGRAVGNLTKTDFELFDERRPQAIGRFSVEKAAATPLSAEQGSPAPAAALVGAEQMSEAGKQNNVAYVFDDLHSTYEDIENARDAAMRHLTEMRPEDQAAVFTTSGSHALGFTADREVLKSALYALKPHSRAASEDCPPMSYYMANQILNQGDGDATATAIANALDCNFHGMRGAAEAAKARQIAMAKAFEVLGTGRVESECALAILHDVITKTAALPGRRSIVLVSPGFLAVDPDAEDKAMALIARAVDAGVVVNTLDVRGVLTTSVSVTALDLANTGQFERQEATARSALMADLAYGTGGTFFHNNNDLDLGFRQTAAAPEYIYVLGFAPQKLDGKFHKLRVKVNGGAKLTVQARAGYYALRPAAAK